ncbi:uncharacterized protein LOC18441386 isoform X2 [Amborella trichopoda]|uniref:uncharacterized protein LOC18441386 isoform X2 n=1 Tax=Amborella trichopoda TaxID=13333 RepID=UPI0009BD03FA|nr:uncharacterized protein LOC18441386 isoform X2 [Amborella trichopoda]|eukprot:XP_020527365.1 uncharacterized protein LOC18441386 isoform X2 [Amborella trichopoda]
MATHFLCSFHVMMPDEKVGDQEKPDQGTNPVMEDSTAMTIEFLRARLQSERSLSKSARDKAVELAKRVSELEKQLEIVRSEKESAENATQAVLEVLDSLEVVNISDKSDSDMEQDGNIHESKASSVTSARDNSINGGEDEGNSTTSRLRSDGDDEMSSSEVDTGKVEASQFLQKTLSWRGRDDTCNSKGNFYKKTPDQAARLKYSSIIVVRDSPKRRFGKSCRQIKRRSASAYVPDESSLLSDQGLGGDVSKCMGVKSEILDISHGCIKENAALVDRQLYVTKETMSGQTSGEEGAAKVHPESACLIEDQREKIDPTSSPYRSEGDINMDGALERISQLVNRYKAEESAQREWEERQVNSLTTGSSMPESQSDAVQEKIDGHNEQEPATPPQENLVKIDKEKQEQDCATLPQSNSSVIDTIKKQESSEVDCRRVHSGNHFVGASSREQGDFMRASLKEDVLVALAQAKLTIKHELDRAQPSNGGAIVPVAGPGVQRSSEAISSMEFPLNCSGLFRLPPDPRPEAFPSQVSSSRNYLDTSSNFSRPEPMTNRYPEIVPSFSRPELMASRYPDLGSGILRSERSFDRYPDLGSGFSGSDRSFDRYSDSSSGFSRSVPYFDPYYAMNTKFFSAERDFDRYSGSSLGFLRSEHGGAQYPDMGMNLMTPARPTDRYTNMNLGFKPPMPSGSRFPNSVSDTEARMATTSRNHPNNDTKTSRPSGNMHSYANLSPNINSEISTRERSMFTQTDMMARSDQSSTRKRDMFPKDEMLAKTDQSSMLSGTRFPYSGSDIEARMATTSHNHPYHDTITGKPSGNIHSYANLSPNINSEISTRERSMFPQTAMMATSDQCYTRERDMFLKDEMLAKADQSLNSSQNMRNEMPLGDRFSFWGGRNGPTGQG